MTFTNRLTKFSNAVHADLMKRKFYERIFNNYNITVIDTTVTKPGYTKEAQMLDQNYGVDYRIVTTKTSEIEYCEICGTMTINNVCRRCNPNLIKVNKVGHVTKIYTKNTTKSKSDVMEIHKFGVNHVAKVLLDNGIESTITGDKSISLILNDGKTILVRAKSNEGRLALINNNLDYLKSDFVIVVSNLNYTIPKIYVIPSEKAKQLAVDYPRSTGESEFVISLNDYNRYHNKYNLLEE